MGAFIQVMIANAAALVVLAVLGVAAAWGLSRAMDYSNARHAARMGLGWLQTIQTDPIACGIYYAGRWIGICLLVGWLFSRVV